MLAPYSIPESGFVTLYPRLDLGRDVAVALHRVGIRADRTPTPAFGYGLIVSTGEYVTMMAATEEEARVEATKHAFHHPVSLVRAVARGKITLYERLERIELTSPAVAAHLKDAMLVDPQGVLLEKAFNVYNAVDFKKLATTMSGQLRRIDRKLIRPRLTKMLEQLDVDWTKLSPAKISSIFSNANKFMRGQAFDKILPLWTTKINATLKTISGGVRKQLRNTFLPAVGLSYQREELDALKRIGEQQGWFLRNQQKVISDRMTEAGRKLVQDGLSRGLGRKEIGKELWERFPRMWEGMGKQYADVVAANAVSRARSWSEITTYQTMGIELLEVQAVLDERTTEVCRFMDGQVIDVKRCADLMEQAANVKNPEDIYGVAPFMRVVKTDTGTREIRTMTGSRIAEITRPGAGIVNDRGEHRAFVSGRQLPDKNVGMPPYHHACRSMTVPRVESFQVPRSYQVRAGPARPEPLPVVRTRRRPPSIRPAGAPRGLFAIPPVPRPGVTVPAQRPLDRYPSPTNGRPVPLGQALDIDDLAIPREFFEIPPASAVSGASTLGAVRPFTRDPSGLRNFSKSADYKKITDAAMAEIMAVGDASLAAGLTNEKSILFQVGTKALPGPQTIAALAVNPAMEGREVVFRFVQRDGSQSYLRVSQTHAGKRAINEATKNLQKGTWTDSQALVWLEKAQSDRWVRIGNRLEDVAAPLDARMGPPVFGPHPMALPPGGDPKVKGKPAVSPDKPEKPPTLGGKPAKNAGLKNEVVGSRVYAALPPSNKMVDAAWDGTYGYSQTITITEKGLKESRWKKAPMDSSFFPSLDIRKLELTASDNVVSLYNPKEMTSNHFSLLYGRIIRGEIDRGFWGVREYVIHDVRGQTLFVRYNGARAHALGEKKMTDLLENVVGPVSTSARNHAITQLRKGIAESTTNLTEFWPKAMVNWSRGNLIPGIPIEEQAARRVTQVKREIDDSLAAARAKKNTPLTDREIGKTIDEVLGRASAGVKPSLHMASSNPATSTTDIRGKARQKIVTTNPGVLTRSYRVEPQALVDNVVDAALKDASDGLLLAMQTKPLPVFIGRPSGSRGFHTKGRGTGSAALPAIIVLPQKRSLRIGWTNAGKRSAAYRKSVRGTAQHELQHHIDGVGMNGAAARSVRNAQIIDGTAIDIYPYTKGTKEWAVPGKWVDTYDAKVYQGDLESLTRLGLKKELKAIDLTAAMNASNRKAFLEGEHLGTEFLTMTQERFSGSQYTKISSMWKQAPDQVAVFIAMMRGAFVPF